MKCWTLNFFVTVDVWVSVLGLAGMELILFITAGMVLCFGFVTRTMLITHRCFSFC